MADELSYIYVDEQGVFLINDHPKYYKYKDEDHDFKRFLSFLS